MKRVRNWKVGMLAVAVAALVFASGTHATGFAKPKRTRGNGNASPTTGGNADGGNDGGPEVSSDPRIADAQKDFVVKVAKLAKDYEKGKDTEAARECYEQILRVVPNHPEAQKALERIRDKEMTADSKTMIVKATEKWQDTGINVIANRPINIHAEGNWTFKMTAVLKANGMAIPEEMKEFNLGQLVGQIVTAGDPKDIKPFAIGEDADVTPDQAGRLMLRMYDYDPSDNAGKLTVTIQGTFERGGR
jgi:hypothetical protein